MSVCYGCQRDPDEWDRAMRQATERWAAERGLREKAERELADALLRAEKAERELSETRERLGRVLDVVEMRTGLRLPEIMATYADCVVERAGCAHGRPAGSPCPHCMGVG